MYVVATNDFVPADQSNTEELALKYGDVLRVLEKGDDGWWTGRNAEGRVGLFPVNFVAQYNPYG